MEEGILDRAGTGLHYVEWNPGATAEPTVLFLHGLSSNARFWQRVAERIPGRRLVALDQRAHGASSAPDHGYLPQTLAGDAAWVIGTLGLGRVVVVGHSWGASIALELAADFPDLVAGLVVVDGPIRPWSERGLTWEQAATFMQPPLPTYRGLEEAVAEKRRLLKTAWGDDLTDFVRAGLVADGGQGDGALRLPLTVSIRRQILHAMFFQPYDLQWGQVACPVLIAMAESEAPFVDFKRSSAGFVSQQVKGTAVHWFATGHDIPLEDPAGIAADIERTCLRAGLADITKSIVDAVEVSSGLSNPVGWSEGEPGQAWTAKDLLAHLSSTQAALPAVMASASQAPPDAGPVSPRFDPNRWNVSQVGRRREVAVDDLLAELVDSATALDAVLCELAIAAPVTIGTFAGEPAPIAMRLMLEHQRGHLVELRSALSPDGISA
ncbi:MAG: alpha/beta fold hydrolase, partial [Candidatus Dormibacteraeota bacterium]|nr:alpha/beta fold hydrolase [Candidatus Dormibacteraeota bacterium]